MPFELQDAWAKVTTTGSQRIDISSALAAMRTKLGVSYSPFVAVITTETADLVIKQGDGTVTADDTLTADKYVTGNYPCTAGTVQEIFIKRDTTHLAFKAEAPGNVKIAIGYNVKENL